jgi:hypothetical protein
MDFCIGCPAPTAGLFFVLDYPLSGYSKMLPARVPSYVLFKRSRQAALWRRLDPPQAGRVMADSFGDEAGAEVLLRAFLEERDMNHRTINGLRPSPLPAGYGVHTSRSTGAGRLKR